MTGVNITNQKQYIADIEKEFNITKPEDWYNFGYQDVNKQGGARLLTIYGHSLVKLLKAIRPEYDLKPWLFAQAGRNFWSDMKVSSNQI
jgi:hypothetical protein